MGSYKSLPSVVNVIYFTKIYTQTFRIPTVWNRFANCTKSHFGAICDYQEFRNLNGDAKTYKHEVKTGNEFDLAMVRFWDEILFM